MNQSITYKHYETPKGEYSETLNFDGENFTQNKYRYYRTDSLEKTIQGFCLNGGFLLDKTSKQYVLLSRPKDDTKIYVWFDTNEIEIISERACLIY